MADTKATALSAFTPILTDILYGVDDPGGTPVSGKVTLTSVRDLLQANLTKATIAAAANAEAIVSTGHSLTGANAQSLVDLSGTWNTTGTPTAIKLNVTDSASNAASKLLDLQVGGSSKIVAKKDGQLEIGNILGFRNGSTFKLDAVTTSTLDIYTNALAARLSSSLFAVKGGIAIAASSPAVPSVYLTRDADNTLALRNGANQQTMNVYGTYTDASNYRRIAITMTTAGVASIAPAGAGTGASGNVLHISGLPTSNPGPGILWNNAGTPAIGT